MTVADLETRAAGVTVQTFHSAPFLGEVAELAGESYTGRPSDIKSVCPTLAWFGQMWNDGLRDDTERLQLQRYIQRLVGTRTTDAVEQARREMVWWWLVREHTPAWLDLVGLDDHANNLRTMQQVDMGTIRAAVHAARGGAVTRRPAVNADIIAARQARRAAAGTATYVAGAPWDTYFVSEAADAAATTAVVSVAWGRSPDEHWASLLREATQTALEPTVQALQNSAHVLFDQIIDLGATQ